MKKAKKIFVISIFVITAIIFIYAALPSYSRAGVKDNSNTLRYGVFRYQVDMGILQNMNFPKGVHFEIKEINRDNTLIFITFPKDFPLEKKVYLLRKIQKAIMKSKEESRNNSLKNLTTTNYYIYNSKIFSGLYGERIYNSINGKIYTTPYPLYYKIRVTGTVAGIVSDYTSHYLGLRLDSTIHVRGLILGGSAGSGVSVSISPSEATFSYSVTTLPPHSTCIWDFDVTAIANKAFKVGIDNDVRENNSGHWYFYHLYAYRWIYAY